MSVSDRTLNLFMSYNENELKTKENLGDLGWVRPVLPRKILVATTSKVSRP